MISISTHSVLSPVINLLSCTVDSPCCSDSLCRCGPLYSEENILQHTVLLYFLLSDSLHVVATEMVSCHGLEVLTQTCHKKSLMGCFMISYSDWVHACLEMADTSGFRDGI